MFGHLLCWYTIYTFFGALPPPNGILAGAKLSLRPNLAFCYIGSVTAQHSSTGCQPNFMAFSRGRHLYSAGRPSRWASAHILVYVYIYLSEVTKLDGDGNMCIVTGSIARSATRRYLSYSEADFEVFRPTGATRCTDGVKFGMEEGPSVNLKPP